MELGVYTFAELTSDEVSPQERLRDLLEEIELADQVGLDVFGVGEHHRPDFAVSAPAVVLAAAAERTKQIRLTSAVTVLSSDDPVRVFQDFATVDLLSGGRAEIMAGRGSFIESFPLFGYDPATLPSSINAHGFIADASQQAADESFGPFKATMDRIGRERGWPPMSRQQFEASRTLRGANFIGSPQVVIEKILFQYEIFH